MGVGSYSYEESNTIEFSQGKVITRYNLDIEYLEDVRAGELQVSNYFKISIRVNLDHEGNIENMGIQGLNYSIFLNNERTIFKQESLNLDGAESFQNAVIRQLNKGSRVIFTGLVEYSFYLDGELHEEITEFNLVHTQSVDSGFYVYSVDIPLIWLTLLYFTVIGVMVIALGKVVWNIRFSLWYSDDQRKRDEYFQGYIRRLGEEKEAENTA